MNDSTYWDIFQRGLTALHAGRLSEAEEIFRQSRLEAEKRSLHGLADRAFCNLAAIRLEIDGLAPVRDGLSRIVGQSDDAKARQLAAYHLGYSYRNRGNLRAAKLYGEMSVQMAESARDAPAGGASHHFLGLLHLSELRLTAAADHFRKALELSTRSGTGLHALVTLSAQAYCLGLAGSWNESAWMLEESQSLMEEFPDSVYESSVRLNLGFTFLEAGDFEEALEQGREALAAAGENRSSPDAKFACYLAGEALARQGEEAEATSYFEVLQRCWYPQHPEILEVLLSFRTSRLLNWLGH